jgi:lipopolysaccharide/colanic/teichoic acid biosynthesis glycosyltransferase
MLKRSMDLLISQVLLLLLSPLLIAISIAIMVDSRGGVFFRQKRIGLNACEFNILKFRSMVENADQLGSYQTSKNDVRITRVGGILRRTSLDELPQLINVLTGDMSLIGPRPDVPDQRSLYTEQEWYLRTSVRPGITGLAQATLRSSATIEQRKALDLEYASSQSFILDLKILFLTVQQVFTRGGY